jgi:putative heme iron utilization protein
MGDGRPVILVARIATHTANLRRDPRACLFVRQSNLAGDAQKGWRVSLMGRFENLADADPTLLEEVQSRYMERVPGAVGYRGAHGFSYWRMSEVIKARYIAGFGDIHWVGGEQMLRDASGAGIADAGPGAIDHMNADHSKALGEMCERRYGVTAESVRMTHLDRTGFFVRTTDPERLLYFPFGEEISAGTLRQAVVGVLKEIRASPSAAGMTGGQGRSA